MKALKNKIIIRVQKLLAFSMATLNLFASYTAGTSNSPIDRLWEIRIEWKKILCIDLLWEKQIGCIQCRMIPIRGFPGSAFRELLSYESCQFIFHPMVMTMMMTMPFIHCNQRLTLLLVWTQHLGEYLISMQVLSNKIQGIYESRSRIVSLMAQSSTFPVSNRLSLFLPLSISSMCPPRRALLPYKN